PLPETTAASKFQPNRPGTLTRRDRLAAKVTAATTATVAATALMIAERAATLFLSPSANLTPVAAGGGRRAPAVCPTLAVVIARADERRLARRVSRHTTQALD